MSTNPLVLASQNQGMDVVSEHWLGCWVSFSPAGVPLHSVKVKEQIDADVPRTRRLAHLAHLAQRYLKHFPILWISRCWGVPCCNTQHGHVRNSLVVGRHTELRRVLHALGAHRPEIGYAQGMCHGKIWEKYVKVGKCLIVFNCQDFLSLPCQEDAACRFMFMDDYLVICIATLSHRVALCWGTSWLLSFWSWASKRKLPFPWWMPSWRQSPQQAKVCET